MKTKDLIELLQQADPGGNLHVYLHGPGSIPISVIKTSDSYEYQDGERIIFSQQGEKVDIYTLNLESWMADHYHNWEQLIEFKYDKEERIKEIKNKLQKMADEAAEFEKQSVQDLTRQIILRMQQGYKVIQENTNSKNMYFVKPGSKIQLSDFDCRAIIRGSFKPVIKNNYIEWELKDAQL